MKGANKSGGKFPSKAKPKGMGEKMPKNSKAKMGKVKGY